MTVYYKKPEHQYNMCGCIGAIYGEPFCPCIMARGGLAMSDEHVAALDESRKNLDSFFTAFQRKKEEE